jgi:hypothetical protein
MHYCLTLNISSLILRVQPCSHPILQDGRISYEEFAAMMKAGTDWRKASRQYSRERFNSLSLKLMRDGSLQLANEGR